LVVFFLADGTDIDYETVLSVLFPARLEFNVVMSSREEKRLMNLYTMLTERATASPTHTTAMQCADIAERL